MGQDLIEVICQYSLLGSCVYADFSSTFADSHTCKLDTQKQIAIEYNFDVSFTYNYIEIVRGLFFQSDTRE